MNKSRKMYVKNVGDSKRPKIISQAMNDYVGKEVMNKTQNNENVTEFANITHKHFSGANNWKKFIESKPHNISTEERKLNSKTHSKQLVFGQPKVNSKNNISPVPVAQHHKINDKFQNVPNNKFKPVQQSIFQAKSNLNRPTVNEQRFMSEPQFNVVKTNYLTKQIALDCEMVGVEIGVNGNMLARVSLVNALGDCVYDKYVKPTEPVLDYRTRFSGIRPKDLENAVEFKVVQQEVADILKGRILIGHALKNDLSVLFLTHPKLAMRDTSKYHKFRHGKTPALKKLAKQFLGVDIQDGEHSSIQDALASMQLYRMFRKEWEANKGPKKKFLKHQSKSVPNKSSLSLSGSLMSTI